MKKGIGILALAIIIMLGLSIFTATTIWGKNKLFQKRIYEKKITMAANELETYSNLINSASDLATIQAIYDVGYSSIIYEDEKYNPINNLPYYSSNKKIKNHIVDLACLYYENYKDSYSDYFTESNEYYSTIYKKYEQWKLISEDEISECKKISFSDNKIKINFGNEIITYHSNYVEKMEKTFPVESSVDTKFGQIISISEDIKNEIYDYYILGLEEFSLTDIESKYSFNQIKVNLKDEGDYILVHIYEEKLYPVYSFEKNEVILDNLGLKFLIGKIGEDGISGDELGGLQKCESGLLIKTQNKEICKYF